MSTVNERIVSLSGNLNGPMRICRELVHLNKGYLDILEECGFKGNTIYHLWVIAAGQDISNLARFLDGCKAGFCDIQRVLKSERDIRIEIDFDGVIERAKRLPRHKRLT